MKAVLAFAQDAQEEVDLARSEEGNGGWCAAVHLAVTLISRPETRSQRVACEREASGRCACSGSVAVVRYATAVGWQTRRWDTDAQLCTLGDTA